MKADESVLLLHTGRYERSENGELKIRYTAIDPADKYVTCNCGKPDCWTRELRPIREHIRALIHALSSCGVKELLEGGVDPWPGTLYSLQMAASIEDIFVDPSFIDESEAAFWCSSAWKYDEEQREQASKYVAALTVFNFVWIAYESAIEDALGTSFPKDKQPVRARKFLQTANGSDVTKIPAFSASYKAARHISGRISAIRSEITDIETKYKLDGAAAAAELVRIFRNHVVHGRDGTPLSTGSTMVSHFYSMSRLLLLLIQIIAVHALREKSTNISLSIIDDEQGELPADRVLFNLHRPEGRWLTAGISEDLS
jgi:hypothetical protein